MGIEFINKVIVLSLILALLGLIVGGSYYSLWTGLAVFIGAAWSCVNLYFIKSLVQSALDPVAKSYLNVVLTLAVKFPLLYLVGFWVLKMSQFPTLGLLMGFSLIFVVILIKGLFVWIKEPKESKPT